MQQRETQKMETVKKIRKLVVSNQKPVFDLEISN